MIETDLDALDASDVVTNSRMNRTRSLVGINSYERELGFNPIEWLADRGPNAAWLDLCCGAGLALAHASAQVKPTVELMGVDLVEGFVRFGRFKSVGASLRTFEPTRQFDLITIVHGLHYIGDKLDLISRAARWLVPDGLMVANLDRANIKGVPPRVLFKNPGMTFDGRKHRLRIEGHQEYSFPYRFAGYDSHAGPNYTHQDAVTSYYEKS